MSANGEAPFFNAPELPHRDGTLSEAPEAPAETFADPVAGLVTAGSESRNGGEPLPVARPVQADDEVVRRMVEETLREEEHKTPPAGTTALPPVEPIGLLPRQRTWPSRPPQLLRPLKKAEEPEDDDLEVVAVKRRKLPSLSMPAFNRPSSSAAGVMLAVVLLIVFGIVAIEMVSSLVSSVTGLFD